MGQYVNPAALNDLERLPGSGMSELPARHEHYKIQAKGLHLIGKFDRGIFFVAPVLDSLSEFIEFVTQYQRGLFLSCDFYAVTDEFIEAHSQ